jgi:peptide/nickel transport system substrate-binding protein
MAAASAPAAPAPTAAAKVKMGGTFRGAFQNEAPNLDPHQVTTSTLHVTGPGVAYSKLLQYRTDVTPGETVPTGDLAASWDQPDDVTYVFKLRPNAKWHNIAPLNGRQVTAEDIKYSYERQIALNFNAGRLPKLAKIEVVDPTTLKLTSAQPDADFLTTLSFSYNKIVPRETVEAKGDLKEGPVIGSGAWIFDRWDKNSLVRMRKNPDYYIPGYPRVDQLDMVRVPDPSTAVSAFRAKEADALTTGLLVSDADALQKANPEVVRESYQDAQGVWMNINASKAPFSDLRVRQAIFKAIDKKALIDLVFGGQGWYFAGLRLPSKDYYLPDAEIQALYKQDLEAAKQLLSQAGMATGLDLELFALGSGQTFKDASELVQADLKKVGVTSRIRVSEGSPPWTSTIYTGGPYDVALGALSLTTANSDLGRLYHSTAAQNSGRVKDPALDAAIEKQAVLVKDPEGRKKILLDLQRTIINNAQAVYLVGSLPPSVRWKYVQDYWYMQNVEEIFPPIWLDK